MQTSSPPSATAAGSAPLSAVEAITTAHLILIAVLAVLVVIGMLYGVRLKRRRRHALEEEKVRLDAYADEHPDAPAPEASPRQPTPPAEPATTAPGQEGQRSPVRTPPIPPHDPADRRVPSVSVAGTGMATAPASAGATIPADGPVTQLKGLGPKVAMRLAELGIDSIGQIAALDDDAAAALDAKLGAFQGRIARDRWVEQARFLAAGDRAGFEAVFGRL
ncbi:MAG: hypothetical protein ACRYFW_01985 [Janthinobacterium lividum]